MANREQYKTADIEKALRETKGLLTVAAKRVGCSYNTLKSYINKYKTLQSALHEINENRLDFTESKLLKKIDNDDLTAIIFYLKCKGKSRGYVEKSEVEHSGAISVTEFLNALPPATARDARKLLAEELIRRRAGKKVD